MKKILVFLVVLGLGAFWVGKKYEIKVEFREKKYINEYEDEPRGIEALNSRYKLDGIVKSILVDLDNDGEDELASITKYDDGKYEVFYYCGFYRYNEETKLWDEYYSEELNILNLGLIEERDDIEEKEDMKKKFMKMWKDEPFTKVENVGDITGDGYPEILFSSVIQGAELRNNIVIAQSGQSHYRFVIHKAELPWGKVTVEDGYLIEKYVEFGDDYDRPVNNIKDILEWNDDSLRFELVKTSKEPYESGGVEIPPELERFSG